MKKLIVAGGAALALAAAAGAANAQPAGGEFYGNIGYSQIDWDGPNIGAITGRLGGRIIPMVGVELEGSIGVRDGSQGGLNYKLRNDIGIYGTGFLPLGENFDLIGRIGYGRSEARASGGGITVSGDDTSWRYGLGAQWFWGGGVDGLRADYTRFEFDDGGDADAVTVSYVRRF